MATRKRKRRDHIPALSEDGLKLAIQEIEALKISRTAKNQLIEMLKAAANPASESIDVVVATLDLQRRKDVEDTATSLNKNMAGAAKRGKQGLQAMSDEEFQQLVDEANGGN